VKILLDTQWFAPVTGGIETFVETLATGLARQHGADVTVVTHTPAPVESDAERPYAVVRGPSEAERHALLGAADRVVYNVPQVRLLPHHAARRIPYVFVFHGFADAVTGSARERAKGHLRQAAQTAFIHGARVVAVPSQHVAEALPFRTRLIPHGVSAETFRPLGADRRGVLYLGRLAPGKGADVLLTTWLRLHESGRIQDVEEEHRRLTLVGGRGDVRAAVQWCHEVGIGDSVTFDGVRADPADVNAMINAHAMGVVPSTAPETFGLVGLEMQAGGLPVIATTAGGLPEAVGDGALLVEPGDVDALTEALHRLLTSPAERDRLTELGRANAERLSADRMVDAYWAMLNDAAIWR